MTTTRGEPVASSLYTVDSSFHLSSSLPGLNNSAKTRSSHQRMCWFAQYACMIQGRNIHSIKMIKEFEGKQVPRETGQIYSCKQQTTWEGTLDLFSCTKHTSWVGTLLTFSWSWSKKLLQLPALSTLNYYGNRRFATVKPPFFLFSCSKSFDSESKNCYGNGPPVSSNVVTFYHAFHKILHLYTNLLLRKSSTLWPCDNILLSKSYNLTPD